MGGFELRWIDRADRESVERLRGFASCQPLDCVPLFASLDQPGVAERSRLLEVVAKGRSAAWGAIVDGVFPYRSAPLYGVLPGGTAAAARALEPPLVVYTGQRYWSELEAAGGRPAREELQMARLQRLALPEPDPRVERLQEFDELKGFPGGPLSPVHFESGPCLGIRDGDGALACVGGVQVVTERFAQLGGIATRPDRRRQGLARAVVAELVRVLEEKGRAIVLHVALDNRAALELYAGLGFRGRRRVRLYEFA